MNLQYKVDSSTLKDESTELNRKNFHLLSEEDENTLTQIIDSFFQSPDQDLQFLQLNLVSHFVNAYDLEKKPKISFVSSLQILRIGSHLLEL